MLTRSHFSSMINKLNSGEVEMISPYEVPESCKWMCLISISQLESLLNNPVDMFDQLLSRVDFEWCLRILASRRDGGWENAQGQFITANDPVSSTPPNLSDVGFVPSSPPPRAPIINYERYNPVSPSYERYNPATLSYEPYSPSKPFYERCSTPKHGYYSNTPLNSSISSDITIMPNDTIRSEYSESSLNSSESAGSTSFDENSSTNDTANSVVFLSYMAPPTYISSDKDSTF